MNKFGSVAFLCQQEVADIAVPDSIPAHIQFIHSGI